MHLPMPHLPSSKKIRTVPGAALLALLATVILLACSTDPDGAPVGGAGSNAAGTASIAGSTSTGGGVSPGGGVATAGVVGAAGSGGNRSGNPSSTAGPSP